ncbi:MAG: hypothetical protein JWR05_1568 [Mucilaginibacter sp.]|nr:hypothetical protein [Mucilaginibacter sp.]
MGRSLRSGFPLILHMALATGPVSAAIPNADEPSLFKQARVDNPQSLPTESKRIIILLVHYLVSRQSHNSTYTLFHFFHRHIDKDHPLDIWM